MNQAARSISLSKRRFLRYGRPLNPMSNTVFGSHKDDDNSGAAYIFRFDGVNWVQATKLLPASMTAGDEFGFAVAVSGETVAIGARKDDTNEINSGSVYIFDLNCSPPCLPDVNGDGVLTPTDFTAWINAFNNTLPKCDQNGDGNCDPTTSRLGLPTTTMGAKPGV